MIIPAIATFFGLQILVPANDNLIAPLMAAERNSPAAATADVAFNCPVCSQRIQTESQNRGQETTCPSCGSAIVIP
jgi:DNA-directed RNA polymerase subunit RPC12/RpoP